MLLEGIYARLASDAGVVALGGQIFAGLATEEAALPYIVYSQVGAGSVGSYDGNNRLQSARVRFSCYGTSYSVAKRLAAAIKNSLGGLLATLSDGTRVEGAWLEFEGDETEAAVEGTIFASHVDFSLNFVDNA